MPRPTPIAAIAVLVTAAHAGPLTPPPGPPAPTDTALRQTDPRIPVGIDTTPGDIDAVYRITQPGSYYLTADVIAGTGFRGIEIEADAVSLDLNGFSLIGLTGSSDAIVVIGQGAIIHSGFIRDWGGNGISAFNAPDAFYHSIAVSQCQGRGFWLADGSTITSATASFCGQSGFQTNGWVTFNACHAEYSGEHGFKVQGVLTNCTADHNTLSGFSLWQAIATNCRAGFNTEAGFEFRSQHSSTNNCYAHQNANGFLATSVPAVLTHCVAAQNTDDGFFMPTQGNTLRNCTAFANGDDGFQLGTDNAATHCTATDNAFGFFAPTTAVRVTITDCIATNNTTTGFICTAPDGLYIRNHAKGNGGADFAVSPTTQYGPIVTSIGPLTTTSPHANFAATPPVTAASAKHTPTLAD